jgi:hypothetical protein
MADVHVLLVALLAACVTAIGTTAMAAAQDLEPRAYAASPVGAHFLVVAVGRSTGGVVVDPSLPVEDVEASVNSLTVGAGTTMNLFGRTALLAVALPFVWADVSGRVGEDRGSVSRAGFADSRLKLSVNLIGGRALTPREFASAQRPTILGVSLTVATPVGQYDPARLINLGSNRWAFKPEIGMSRLVRRKWTIEGYAGVLFFTENDEYYTGASVHAQKPVFAYQGHVSYTLKPRLWFAIDGTWYSGGTTRIDGVERADLKRNSRLGGTISLPLGRRQSLKIAGSTGATTRFGSDFKTIAAAWQLAWFD